MGFYQTCPKCKGSKHESSKNCQCLASSRDGRTPDKYCNHCGGTGRVKCYSCSGTGKVYVGNKP